MPNAGPLAFTERPLTAMHLNDECDRAPSVFAPWPPNAEVGSGFFSAFAGFDLSSGLHPSGKYQEQDFLLILAGIRLWNFDGGWKFFLFASEIIDFFFQLNGIQVVYIFLVV